MITSFTTTATATATYLVAKERFVAKHVVGVWLHTRVQRIAASKNGTECFIMMVQVNCFSFSEPAESVIARHRYEVINQDRMWIDALRLWYGYGPTTKISYRPSAMKFNITICNVRDSSQDDEVLLHE